MLFAGYPSGWPVTYTKIQFLKRIKLVVIQLFMCKHKKCLQKTLDKVLFCCIFASEYLLIRHKYDARGCKHSGKGNENKKGRIKIFLQNKKANTRLPPLKRERTWKS